jgi:putative holliday junction resolvase
MRTLAIDLGTRRVGLALSDAGGTIATPLDVISINSPEQAEIAVAQVAQREGAQRLVVGLPLNMDDTHGPAATQAVAWGQRLARRCGLPVVFVDERLSSFRAEQQLAARRRGGEKLTRAMKKARLDALAAAAFLQDFLDGRLASPPAAGES